MILIVRGLIYNTSTIILPVAKDIDERRRQFGARVRFLRSQAGLSQEGFAASAGIDRTYIGSLERGERNVGIDNILKISDALQVSPSELFVEWTLL